MGIAADSLKEFEAAVAEGDKKDYKPFFKPMLNVMHKVRYEGWEEKLGGASKFTNEDGSSLEYSFYEYADKTMKVFTSKNHKNALHIALKKAGVEKGDSAKITKREDGTFVNQAGETINKFKYEVEKFDPSNDGGNIGTASATPAQPF